MDTISIEDFLKADIRTGTILTARPVPNSKKLLRLEVDTGDSGKRQIIAGIAPFVSPETLMGRECVVVVNLEPKTLAGLESQGMLLASSYTDETGAERFSLVRADATPSGCRIR